MQTYFWDQAEEAVNSSYYSPGVYKYNSDKLECILSQ